MSACMYVYPYDRVQLSEFQFCKFLHSFRAVKLVKSNFEQALESDKQYSSVT